MELKMCTHCRHEIITAARFCPFCGESADRSSASARSRLHPKTPEYIQAVHTRATRRLRAVTTANPESKTDYGWEQIRAMPITEKLRAIQVDENVSRALARTLAEEVRRAEPSRLLDHRQLVTLVYVSGGGSN